MVGTTAQLERIELWGTRNLIVAARSARVGRIIALSHLGASSASRQYTLLRIKGLLEDGVRRQWPGLIPSFVLELFLAKKMPLSIISR